jgi:hypothetical protein
MDRSTILLIKEESKPRAYDPTLVIALEFNVLAK